MAIPVGAVDIAVRFLTGDARKELARDATAAADVAGDKAGTAFGAKFGATAKRLIAAGLAGAFAVATKDALALDNALRQVAAASGIAEGEMAGFKSTVVDLFKANPTKGFEEIAGTIGALKTDLGLSAVEAGKAAQAFLDFSKVTGQDGVSAVKGIDDVLDAFTLTASDSVRIMDLLVAGQQKYGGSVADNQKALAELAPQLRALGTDLEGGAALLNLFATTGLDASKATFALNTAVRTLKPGQTLDDLIAQIAAIEDPTLRAQEAIKVFGARGGVSLANALRPGMTGLDEFRISATEAADAVTIGADKIDDSFQNKITSAFRTFISGPLADLGPAVATAISTLAGLTTALVAMGVTLDVLKAKALATWAALAGAAVGGAAVVPAVALEAIKNPLNDFLQGLLGIGDAGDRVSASMFSAWGAVEAGTPKLEATTQAVQDAARAWGDFERAATEATSETADAAERQAASVISHYDEMRIQVLWSSGQTAEALLGALSDVMPDIEAESAEAATLLPDAIEDEIGRVEQGGFDTINAFIDAIENGRADFVDAWAEFENAQKNSLTTQERIGRLGGLLQTKALAKGIDDARPDVRGRARAVVLEALSQLIALGGAAGLAGTAAGQRFAASFGAGAGMMDAEFQPAVVSTKQILDSLNGAFAAGGIAITEYDGDLDKLRRDMLGLGADTERTTGATRDKTVADKGAAAAAKEHTDAVKGKLTDALRTAKDAALDYFSRIHDANLQSIRDSADRTKREIDDARARIRAHLDEIRATAEAPVTAAEQAQRAIEDARTLRDLQERLSEAQQSGDARAVRSAEEALQSFQARQQIDALRLTADAQISAAEAEAKLAEDALDARQKAEDARTAILVEAEEERFEIEKKAFDRAFDLLSTNIEAGKVKHEEITAAIEQLYADFGLTMEKAAAAVGIKIAAGLLASKNAVEEAALELAEVIEKYLKTASPAKAGPLHETSPEQMGERVGAGFRKGLRSQILGAAADIGLALRSIPLAYAAPSLAFAAAAGGVSATGSGSSVDRSLHLSIGQITNPVAEPAGISIRRRLALVAGGLSPAG